MKNNKILIISGYTPSIVNFRGDLIKEMASQGIEVVTVGPELGYESKIAELGARFIHLPLNRTSMNPLKDLIFMGNIRKIILKEKPDIVFSYTIKPVIFGSIAAQLAGVKKIYSMVTGLGYVFIAEGMKASIIRTLSKGLYNIAIKCCEKVIFQNPDDMREFINVGLINEGKCQLVNGSGVNLEKFKFEPLPNQPVFLMICRILKDKGVMEFIQAACQVKQIHPEARFQLVGPFDANPNSLSYKDIEPYITNNTIEYLGETNDVRPFISRCSVYVLPSYREGTPRTVLEAMAMGRPIITTDAPGCRETVINEENGFLVPIRNVDTLVEKMCWMIENNDEVKKMAKKSHSMCKEKYDVHKINSLLISVFELEKKEVG